MSNENDKSEMINIPRKQGHSALLAKDGKIEKFDPHPLANTPDSTEWWRSIAQGLGVKLYASNDALKLGLEALEGTSAIDVLEVMAIMREAIKGATP